MSWIQLRINATDKYHAIELLLLVLLIVLPRTAKCLKVYWEKGPSNLPYLVTISEVSASLCYSILPISSPYRYYSTMTKSLLYHGYPCL